MVEQANAKEHINNRQGRPFCGARGRCLRATSITDDLCEDCLLAYRSYAFNHIHRRISMIGKDIGVYLALMPEEARDQEFDIIIKTLGIKTRRYLEGEGL